MDISLTPHELRDLLIPMLKLNLRGPREPLDLDRMTRPAAADMAARLDDAADTDGLTAQRSLIVTLADLAQAQEELARVRTIKEEEEATIVRFRLVSDKVRPLLEAKAVLDRVAEIAVALERHLREDGLAKFENDGLRVWLLESRRLSAALASTVDADAMELEPGEAPPASTLATLVLALAETFTGYTDTWLEDLKRHVRDLLEATGAQAPAHILESLQPLEPPAVEPSKVDCVHSLAARVRRRYGAECLDCGKRFEGEEAARFMESPAVELTPAPPGLNFGGRRSTLGADSEDLVPPAGPFESPNVVIEPKGDSAGPRQSQCKHCGEELRLYPEGWIDAETHATAEDGHKHEPAEDATGDADDPEIFF